MAQRHEGSDAVAYDLRGGQQGNGEKGARDAPHPIPEDEGGDDQDRIEDESPGEKHGRDHLAFQEVDREIESGRDDRLPDRVETEQADQEQDDDPAEWSEDRDEVQQEGQGSPQHGVGEAAGVGDEAGGDAHAGVHQAYGPEIGGQAALDFLGYGQDAFAVLQPRQHFDEPHQQQVAGNKKKEQQQHHGAKAGQHVPRTAEQHSAEPGPLYDGGGRRGRAARQLFQFQARILDFGDRASQKQELGFQPRQAVRSLGEPVGGGTRHHEAERQEDAEQNADDEQGGGDLRHAQHRKRAHGGLQDQAQQEGEYGRKCDLAGEVEGVEKQQRKDAEQKNGRDAGR